MSLESVKQRCHYHLLMLIGLEVLGFLLNVDYIHADVQNAYLALIYRCQSFSYIPYVVFVCVCLMWSH